MPSSSQGEYLQELQYRAQGAAEVFWEIRERADAGDPHANFRDIDPILSSVGESIIEIWLGMLVDSERLCVEMYISSLQD